MSRIFATANQHVDLLNLSMEVERNTRVRLDDTLKVEKFK